MNTLIKDLMARLAGQVNGSDQCKKNTSKRENCNDIKITPSQLVVIAGILGGVLEVDSITVDKDQTVQILLEGSLKRKTELEKVMDEIGQKPFDEVLKAMLGRL